MQCNWLRNRFILIHELPFKLKCNGYKNHWCLSWQTLPIINFFKSHIISAYVSKWCSQRLLINCLMTLPSSPLLLREQILLTLKIEKINLKQWKNNGSLCDSVFCVVWTNTYMNLTDRIKGCFYSLCTGCSLSGRSLTSPQLILLMKRLLRQKVRCITSIVLCTDWCHATFIWCVGYSPEPAVNS